MIVYIIEHNTCVICGREAHYGIASHSGPEGCREAKTNNRLYCDDHILDAVHENAKELDSE
jgi:hypothetical protein